MLTHDSWDSLRIWSRPGENDSDDLPGVYHGGYMPRPGDAVEHAWQPPGASAGIILTVDPVTGECTILWSKTPHVNVQRQNITSRSRKLKHTWSVAHNEDVKFISSVDTKVSFLKP